MKRRDWLKAAVAMAVGVMATLQRAAAAAPDAATYQNCAKACHDCQKACEACAKHCAEMVKAGMKEHVKSLHLAQDCADLCAVCAKLCDRKGPMAVAAAEACKKASDTCGAECKKYPTMATMAACAKSCAACSAACKALIAA